MGDLLGGKELRPVPPAGGILGPSSLYLSSHPLQKHRSDKNASFSVLSLVSDQKQSRLLTSNWQMACAHRGLYNGISFHSHSHTNGCVVTEAHWKPFWFSVLPQNTTSNQPGEGFECQSIIEQPARCPEPLCHQCLVGGDVTVTQSRKWLAALAAQLMATVVIQ